MKKVNFLSLTLIALLLALPSSTFAASFNDVPSTHSNYEDVMYLLEKGVIDESTNYGISDIVTREEVAVMVSKAVGLDGTPRETKFSDVPKSNPNSGYIQSAVEAGIINGYEDGTFRPNNKVTRGHMAAFIARAFDLPVVLEDSIITIRENMEEDPYDLLEDPYMVEIPIEVDYTIFKDVPKGHTAYEAVYQLAAANITTGYEDGTFRPGNNLTRGNISAFLARAIRYQESLNKYDDIDGISYDDSNEAVYEVGKSSNNAAKINQTILIDVDNWLNGKQKFELTLTDVVEGQDAWNMIKKANMVNEEADEGMKYVIAKFKVKVVSLEKESMQINHDMFEAVSNNGVTYNDFLPYNISFDLIKELNEGTTQEWLTYFMVDENDSPKVVFSRGGDTETWFDLAL